MTSPAGLEPTQTDRTMRDGMTAEEARLHALFFRLSQEEASDIQWALAQIDVARAERDRLSIENDELSKMARTAMTDAQCAADAIEALRKIGSVIGCEHVDGPDDRARLVRCVREEFERLTKERDQLIEWWPNMSGMGCVTSGYPGPWIVDYRPEVGYPTKRAAVRAAAGLPAESEGVK